MTRILVTGASGFIGRHLVPHLTAAGYDVFGVDSTAGDVAEQTTWARFPPAELVVHLAGKSFVPESWTDPAAFIKCNVQGTLGALTYAKSHGARLVYVSSYLYGDPASLPIPETAPLVATNPYALSKKLAEEACRFFSDRLAVPVTVLRPFNVYGPGQADSFLLPRIVRQVQEGAAIRVKDLEPKRDYVFIDDVVHALLAALADTAAFSVFNVGSGCSHSVKQLIDMVQAAFGTDLPVYSEQERRKDEVMDTVADIRRAKQALGWAPQWTLAQGIAEWRARQRREA